MWAAIVRGAIRDQEVLVWPENWDAAQIIMHSGTQWRYHPMGGIIGLDNPGVESLIRLLELPCSPDTFARVQIMESAIVSFFAERARIEASRHGR